MRTTRIQRMCHFVLVLLYLTIVALGVSQGVGADENLDIKRCDGTVVPVPFDGRRVCDSRVSFESHDDGAIRLHVFFEQAAEEELLDPALFGLAQYLGADMQMRRLVDDNRCLSLHCFADVSAERLLPGHGRAVYDADEVLSAYRKLSAV